MTECGNCHRTDVDETKEGNWLTWVSWCEGNKFISTLFLCDLCFEDGDYEVGGTGGLVDYGWSDGHQLADNSETFATLKHMRNPA
ncbi:hypothetical protein CL65_gp088 [Mycobacterium phage Patience]|uniref:Uncharacterized protein n=2 Tax=Patiencevirus patience TaxID=1982360 RepID=A0A0K1LS40_9CAUD|nr:hypothetical protein CL65_gp088 [Mycobacterium phage Patience]AEL98018.1 hypothetical protein PATIENCE_110 [Mycobacterium phage Patience]AKU45396.1 hypothetical protein MADRUGA_107 [Mycobacterium phage Madruga]